jgi:hypothetical protein
MNSRSILLILVLLACTSCQRPDPLDTAAHDYLRLTLALGERDPDALDFYIGPADLAANVHANPPTLQVIARDAATLDHRLAGLTFHNPSRNAGLRAQLASITLRTHMLQGKQLPFDQEAHTLFNVIVTPDTAAPQRAALRSKISALIGPGPHAYTLYDAHFLVPPNKVDPVLRAALTACRNQTLAHIPLPPSEHIDLEYVTDKPWSAFSRYLGNNHSLIQINLDYALTVDRLLDLACHEGYPGHHVFNLTRDAALVRTLPEWQTQPTFSPQSFVSEAAASYAPELAFPLTDRIAIERDVLFPIAGLNPTDAARYVHLEALVAELHTALPAIARDYLDGRLEYVRAADALARETLMEDPQATLLYLNEYRTYILTYTQGHDAIAAYLNPSPPNSRWARYANLMHNPVTTIPTQ